MSALFGITVLELSRVLAGPWCGMQLADLGAEVIKLEPFEGDDTRGLGPPFKDGISAYFACCNRNKRSMAIDLRAAATRPLLESLVRRCDVLIENYRTGTAETLGVGYAELSAINPRLIYCSISGYGRDGPEAMRPGYDYAVQAEAGLMAITGPSAGEPSKVGVAVADLATGQNATTAILAALFQRERSGRGQRIDISLFDTQLSWLANVASSALFTGVEPPRYGNSHPSIVPYQAFFASDGPFVLAVASEKLWAATCAALQQPQWPSDSRFATNAARVKNREVLCAELTEIFSKQTAAFWLGLFHQQGIPAAPINSVTQAINHPLAYARDMRIELGGLPLLGSPLKLSDSPVHYTRPPPQLGEHSDAIAIELGFDPLLLRHLGVIR